MKSLALLLLVLVACLAALPATAQDEASNICAFMPEQCRLTEAPASGFGQPPLSIRPEIEYNICDLWPELCSRLDIPAAFGERTVDLCVLAPTNCELKDTEGAADYFQVRNHIMISPGSANGDALICRFSPESCELGSTPTDVFAGARPEIEYNICDIWPELCRTAGSGTDAVDFCVLVPEQCEVSNREVLMRALSDVSQQVPQ